jgi:uncharacterized surface anchored protein
VKKIKTKLKQIIIGFSFLLSAVFALFLSVPQVANAEVKTHFDVDTYERAHVVQSPLKDPHGDLLVGHYLANDKYEVSSENMGAYYSGDKTNPLIYCVAINYSMDLPWGKLPDEVTIDDAYSAKYAYLIHTYGQSGASDLSEGSSADSKHMHKSPINSRSMYINNAAIHYNLRESKYEVNKTRWTSFKVAYDSDILTKISTLAEELMTDAKRNYGPYKFSNVTLKKSTSAANQAVLSYEVLAASGKTFTGKKTSNGKDYTVQATITSGNATFVGGTTTASVENGTAFPEIVYNSGTTGKVEVSLKVTGLPGTKLTIRSDNNKAGGIDSQSLLNAHTNEKASISANAELVLGKGNVQIEKVDENGQPLAGAVFAVDINGQGSKNYTSDANGLVKLANVTEDSEVTVSEITAPNGYLIDDKEKTTKIVKANQTIVFKYIDHAQKGKIKIEKSGEESGNTMWNGNYTLAGNKFNIYEGTSDAGKLVATLVTDANGKAEVGDLPLGTYFVKEVASSPGFAINPETAVVTLKYNKDVATVSMIVKITNQELTGNIKLEKTDAETGDKPQGDASLSGAEFSLFHKDGTPVKKSESKAVIKVGTDVGKNDEIVVQADGRSIEVDHLALGDYYWLETKAPTGYQLNDEKISFSVVSGSTAVVSIEKTAKDEVIKGDISGIKRGGTPDASKGPALEGVEITATLKSDSSKKYTAMTGKNGFFEIKNLPYGTYIISETKGKTGYSLFKPFEVIVAENGKTYHYETEIIDELVTTQLEVKKSWTVTDDDITIKNYKVTFDVVRYTENDAKPPVKILDENYKGPQLVLTNDNDFSAVVTGLPKYDFEGKEYIYAIENEKVWDISKNPEEEVTNQFTLDLAPTISSKDEIKDGIVFDVNQDGKLEVINTSKDKSLLPVTGGSGMKFVIIIGAMILILVISLIAYKVNSKKSYRI